MRLPLFLILCLLLLLPAGGHGQEPLLRPLTGPPVSLRDLQGKVVVLAFGGTWVPFFSRELTSLQRLANRYESRRVALYWVCTDSDRPGTRNYSSNEDIQQFLRRSNLKVEVLRDPEMAGYRSFGLEAVPTVVLIDQRGNVVRKYIGIETDQGEVYSEIIAEIERLIKQP